MNSRSRDVASRRERLEALRERRRELELPNTFTFGGMFNTSNGIRNTMTRTSNTRPLATSPLTVPKPVKSLAGLAASVKPKPLPGPYINELMLEEGICDPVYSPLYEDPRPRRSEWYNYGNVRETEERESEESDQDRGWNKGGKCYDSPSDEFLSEWYDSSDENLCKDDSKSGWCDCGRCRQKRRYERRAETLAKRQKLEEKEQREAERKYYEEYGVSEEESPFDDDCESDDNENSWIESSKISNKDRVISLCSCDECKIGTDHEEDGDLDSDSDEFN